MRQPVILITGAAGEIGHGLIERLSERGSCSIVALDLKPLPDALQRKITRMITGSILDQTCLEAILAEYEIDTIYHLAALLSTRSEFTPVAAHRVNVEGTLNLLEFAQSQGSSHGRRVTFLYPSSIAVYGIPTREEKERVGRVREDQWNSPSTMYGCNKLYCEHLGRYYSRHYKQLAAESVGPRVDFRAIRFPGLISAATMPSGGTSDFAPEMIHRSARATPYSCFVRPDTRIPFMAMPDAVESLMVLGAADGRRLTREVYNISAFNPSADDFRRLVMKAFPGADISFRTDEKRQAIVDSWPADVDDDAARTDWKFSPRYGLDATFEEYLLPAL